jgi:hypothetical protein
MKRHTLDNTAQKAHKSGVNRRETARILRKGKSVKKPSRQAVEKVWRRAGANQRLYAERTGVRYNRLNRWFRGVGDIFFWELFLIARAENLPMEFFCDDDIPERSDVLNNKVRARPVQKGPSRAKPIRQLTRPDKSDVGAVPADKKKPVRRR